MDFSNLNWQSLMPQQNFNFEEDMKKKAVQQPTTAPQQQPAAGGFDWDNFRSTTLPRVSGWMGAVGGALSEPDSWGARLGPVAQQMSGNILASNYMDAQSKRLNSLADAFGAEQDPAKKESLGTKLNIFKDFANSGNKPPYGGQLKW